VSGITRSNTQFRITVEVEGVTNPEVNDLLSSSLVIVRFTNSMWSCWPVIYLGFNADNQAIIESAIYGQQLINVTIDLLTEPEPGGKEQIMPGPIKLSLMYLESDMDLPLKPEQNQIKKEDVQRRLISFPTIPYPAYNIMSTFVNKIWQEPAAMMPLDIIKQVLDENAFSTEKILDDGMNETFINQLIIPPMSIKQMVDYVHEKFGLYQGPLFRYCHYSGKILLWDLYKKMQNNKDSPTLIIYKVASKFTDSNKYDKITQETMDDWGRTYMTHDTIEAVYLGNASIIRHGFNNIFVTHPRQDLYYIHQKDVDEITDQYGIWHEKNKMTYLEQLRNRKRYITDRVAFENSGYSGVYNDNMITSMLGSKYKMNSFIRLMIYRNFKIENMVKVGEVLEVRPSSDYEQSENANYGGSYIIAKSDICFNKIHKGGGGDNYDASCSILAGRTVHTKV
jgi:hypothetical protein